MVKKPNRARGLHQPGGRREFIQMPPTCSSDPIVSEGNSLDDIRKLAAGMGGIHLGRGSEGSVWTPNETSVLILGPPRSGKTSSMVIPAILAAPSAVVSTSTKPDVMLATSHSRQRNGPCLLYDPSGTVAPSPGVQLVAWSPMDSCKSWDEALVTTRGLSGSLSNHRDQGVGQHWRERAEALLAPLLHAAALDGVPMATVLSWVDRREVTSAIRILDREGASIASDVATGIATTDPREQSGIWSTASGVLAAYRSESALGSTLGPKFDPSTFCSQGGTIYICATGRHQELLAPLVVGIIGSVRAAAYSCAAVESSNFPANRPPQTKALFALDEVANIAPIPDLPAMVSEGGGQGVVTMACLQDLSQARARWGASADGFLSLFGTTVVLPGIADVRTLEDLSLLAGEVEVNTRSVSSPLRRTSLWPTLRGGVRDGRSSVTTAPNMRRLLPVDAIARGMPGTALLVDQRAQMGWITLTPWFREEPWKSAVLAGQAEDRLAEKTVANRTEVLLAADRDAMPAKAPDLGR